MTFITLIQNCSFFSFVDVTLTETSMLSATSNDHSHAVSLLSYSHSQNLVLDTCHSCKLLMSHYYNAGSQIRLGKNMHPFDQQSHALIKPLHLHCETCNEQALRAYRRLASSPCAISCQRPMRNHRQPGRSCDITDADSGPQVPGG